jgi:hypothetical protein
VRTITQALSSDLPSLARLRREMPLEKVEAYIKLWLLDLNMLLDLKKPLNESQIDDIAFRVVDQYGSMNLADIKLVFSAVLDGDQGLVYDRLSIPTVMKWFKDYFEKRMSKAAERSYLQADSHKGGALAQIDRVAANKGKERDAMKRASDYYQHQQALKQPAPKSNLNQD